MTFFTVTVSYNQGVVRKFVVPTTLLTLAFARAAGRLGRIRRLDFGADEFDRGRADHLAAVEGAIILDERGERERQPAEVTRG